MVEISNNKKVYENEIKSDMIKKKRDKPTKMVKG
tara:strand:- start:40 stop:141 length:102 start_codon:yes stop_codon:yes gene_type:complete